MRSRRVFFVISSLSAGGAERIITELANGFSERGHDVTLMTLAGLKQDHYKTDKNVKRIALDLIWNSHSFLNSISSNLKRCLIIRGMIKQNMPDIVITFIDQNNVRVLASLVGAGIPVIASERVDPRRHRQSLLWNIARRMLYPLATRIVVQTEGIALWATGIVRQKNIRVVENLIRTLPPPKSFFNRETKSILAVGRLDHQKGFDLLIHGFALSGLASHGVQLTIIGEGPERKTLETLALKLGLDHAVHMPGVVAEPETWMARATVYVLASRYEGFPNALLESMAMGCPSIATDCHSGPREIIVHNVNGWLVPADDHQALSQSLLVLFGDQDLRARLSLEATKVRDRYSKTKILQEWENMVEEIV